MTEPRLSIEDIRQALLEQAEDLTEASTNLQELAEELRDYPIDHEFWPEEDD
jgi:hypothetical protein